MTIDSFENKKQIVENEKVLLDAFRNKDLLTLDKLIHDDALFILPNGQSVTKKMVTDNYRGGEMNMTDITSSDQVINLIEDTAVVSIILELKGTYKREQVSSRFRYIRVWKLFKDTWRVIATSGVPLNAKP